MVDPRATTTIITQKIVKKLFWKFKSYTIKYSLSAKQSSEWGREEQKRCKKYRKQKVKLLT